MHSSTFIVAFIAALLVSSFALSQSVAMHAVENKRPVYLPKFDEQFRAADKDGDGALTRAEAEAAGMNRIAGNFEHIDGNQDGKVTREELRAMIRRLWS